MASRLRAWIDSQPLGALKELHERTQIPLRTLHRYLDGLPPTLERAIAISAATGGAVRVEDMARTVTTCVGDVETDRPRTSDSDAPDHAAE
jgi:hypothetical protein